MTETTTSTKSKASATKTAQLIRDEVIASVKQAQQFTLDAVTTWVDVVGKVTPDLATSPFAPARVDVVEGLGVVFGVAEELLAAQRKFASDLVSVLVPAS